MQLTLLILCLPLALGLHPFEPKPIVQLPIERDVGEPLYLSPLIASGEIDKARELSKVQGSLPGIGELALKSYSGFITVDEAKDKHMFFWFFEATETAPSEAPVVVWLQGGPGSSSMFGLLELNGPFRTVSGDEAIYNNQTWISKANIIYIDNPVGAGYSYAGSDRDLPKTLAEAGDDLYSMLVQFFKVFEDFRANEFHVIGESYGAKWASRICRVIHEGNEAMDDKEDFINLQGCGIGNGFIEPVTTAEYADVLYRVGLVDEAVYDDLLAYEANIDSSSEAGDYTDAFYLFSNEFRTFFSAMGCDHAYDFTQCRDDPAIEYYSPYMQHPDVRQAVHVGQRPFGSQSSDVYSAMIPDFMRSTRENIEIVLNNYPTFIYNGNLDIICNHDGVRNVFPLMTNWEDVDKYDTAATKVFRGPDGKTFGYLKKAGNLRLMSIRNAGHFVPRDQPEGSLYMFEKYINGEL